MLGILITEMQREIVYWGFKVSEFSVHEWLTSLLWAKSEAVYHGERAWKSKSPQLLDQEAEKGKKRSGRVHREDEPFQNIPPSYPSPSTILHHP